MPAMYVKPYVKTNKSDYIDAEAIAEAVERPKMRFVRNRRKAPETSDFPRIPPRAFAPVTFFAKCCPERGGMIREANYPASPRALP
jgi:hypothetical protein